MRAIAGFEAGNDLKSFDSPSSLERKADGSKEHSRPAGSVQEASDSFGNELNQALGVQSLGSGQVSRITHVTGKEAKGPVENSASRAQIGQAALANLGAKQKKGMDLSQDGAKDLTLFESSVVPPGLGANDFMRGTSKKDLSSLESSATPRLSAQNLKGDPGKIDFKNFVSPSSPSTSNSSLVGLQPSTVDLGISEVPITKDQSGKTASSQNFTGGLPSSLSFYSDSSLGLDSSLGIDGYSLSQSALANGPGIQPSWDGVPEEGKKSVQGTQFEKPGKFKTLRKQLSGEDYMSTLGAVKKDLASSRANQKPQASSDLASSGAFTSHFSGSGQISSQESDSAMSKKSLQSSRGAGDVAVAFSSENSSVPGAIGLAKGSASQKTTDLNAQIVKTENGESRFNTEAMVGLGERLHSISTHGGSGEIRVWLKPENLGGMSIRVMTKGGQVDLQIHASSEKAKRILQDSLGQLKDTLAGHHLALNRVDVSVAGSPNQEMAQDQGHSSYQNSGSLFQEGFQQGSQQAFHQEHRQAFQQDRQDSNDQTSRSQWVGRSKSEAAVPRTAQLGGQFARGNTGGGRGGLDVHA